MKDINRILLQLNRAIELSNSKYPQEKAMSIILFDNLIEVELYKRAEFELLWDRVLHGTAEKEQYTRVRETILLAKMENTNIYCSSLKNRNLFTQQEHEMIKYSHDTRNAVYHRGEDNESKIDIALLIYYSFLKSKLPTWSSGKRFTVLNDGPAFEKIDFGQDLNNNDAIPLLNTKSYYHNALDVIFKKWNISSNLETIATKMMSEQLARIQDNIKFVSEAALEYNFYEALDLFGYLNNLFYVFLVNKKPAQIEAGLLI